MGKQFGLGKNVTLKEPIAWWWDVETDAVIDWLESVGLSIFIGVNLWEEVSDADKSAVRALYAKYPPTRAGDEF